MSQLSLLVLTLWQGVLVDPFPLADAVTKHHQIMLSTAMAPDGHFAVAWVDSAYDSSWRPDRSRLDLYVRFFDKNGNPLADAYKPLKIADTCWTFFPSLDMDSAGNALLVWIENKTRSSEILSNIRFQRFGQNGSPAASAKTLYSQVDIGFPTPISISGNGEFAMAFQTILGDSSGNWAQRFSLTGEPLDSPFLAHAPFESLPPESKSFKYPKISLNDTGDVVVTWLDFKEAAHLYPMFQAFDKDDNPILPWKPEGYRVDDGAELAGACAPKPFWLDNDRFVVFWTDYMVPPNMPDHLIGRVFSAKGNTPNSIKSLIWRDSLWGQAADPKGQFSVAVSSGDRFAHTHTRVYTEWTPDSNVKLWAHAAGILGKVQGNEPVRNTNLFEYTSDWGADTFIYRPFPCQTPSVSVSDERIVWVYSRMTRVGQDSVLKAYAMISDWDMGEGIADSLTRGLNPLSVTVVTGIGRTITLSYSNCPNGFSASVYDATGRKVDELSDPNQSGALVWGSSQRPGVYFIVPHGEKASPSKVVLVK